MPCSQLLLALCFIDPGLRDCISKDLHTMDPEARTNFMDALGTNKSVLANFINSEVLTRLDDAKTLITN